MAQQRLSNDEFLNSLTSLLSGTHSAQRGSIFLTQKPLPATDASSAPQTLIRATNGATLVSKTKSKVPAATITKKHSIKERVKLATVVEAADLEAFYAKYAEICKKGMEGLRKRDKKKAKAKKKGKKNA